MPPATANNAAIAAATMPSGDPPWAAATRINPGIAPSTAASGNAHANARLPCSTRAATLVRLSMAARIAKCLRAAGSGSNSRNRRECPCSGRPPKEPGQPGKFGKAVARLDRIGRPAKLRGRGPRGRNRTRGGSPDMPKAILCGQSCNGGRKDDSRRDTAFHHQVAEPAARVAGSRESCRSSSGPLHSVAVRRIAGIPAASPEPPAAMPYAPGRIEHNG